MDDMKHVFAEMQREYINIFRLMYPSKNGTGFTERNLSVNFAEAYKKTHPDTHVWFEFQFGEKNNLHYDAVIVNPTDREILLVESKRIKSKKMLGEIREDVLRIEGVKDVYAEEFRYRLRDFQKYRIIGIILADVWTQGAMKSDVKEAFLQKTFVKNYYSDLDLESKGLQYSIQSFENQISDHWLSGEYADKLPFVESHYYLLSFSWTVTEPSGS